MMVLKALIINSFRWPRCIMQGKHSNSVSFTIRIIISSNFISERCYYYCCQYRLHNAIQCLEKYVLNVKAVELYDVMSIH
jgi:hypothetical protein